MRIILYTGKGGVGKTSVSAATAVRCAELGYKTIVISTDSAHSLGDSLNKEVGKHPVKVSKDLFAQEIDVNEELKNNWGKIQGFIVKFLAHQGFDQFIAEEFAIFPGLEELFSLLKIEEYYTKGDFDVVIIDCAPTASTVRMLSFPDIVSWYMERFFPIERRLMKTIRPVAEKVAPFPLPSEDVHDSVEQLYGKVSKMKSILTNPKESSVRIIINPEKMVIKESQRAYTYLSLFGFFVDLIVVNRIFPEKITDSYFGKWHGIQKKYFQDIDESFAPIPILKSYLYDKEVVGLSLLSRMAKDIFDDEDPTKVFYEDRPMEIHETDGSYQLTLRLPFVTKQDINMWTRGDELIIELPNFKRNILLPRTLANLQLKGAKFNNEKLTVYFDK